MEQVQRRPRARGGGLPSSWSLGVPPLVVLLVFFVAPYLALVVISFLTASNRGAYVKALTLANYSALLSDLLTWRSVWQTLWIGAVVTAITLLISYPVAYHLARASKRWQGPLMILVISPLLVGVLIRTYGWMIILSNTGLVDQVLRFLHGPQLQLMDNNAGVIIGLVHIYVPFIVLSLAGPLRAINPDLQEAARGLGARGWQTFWRVTFPLSLPGVTAGTVLIFVLSASSYVIPTLLGGYKVLTVPVLVVQAVTSNFDWPKGSALAMVFLVVVLIIVWLYTRVMNRLTRVA